MTGLLVVDVQNDFCPGGALPTLQGDVIVPVVNRMVERFPVVVLTQDWHPSGHTSFASSHAGGEPFETIDLDYGEQVLWPDHCVQGTLGAELHPDLARDRAQLVIRKGFRPGVDSYSAFQENDRSTATGLHGYLQERGVDAIVVCGLATDYCVKWSALDARELGYDVTVATDAISGVEIPTIEDALRELDRRGVALRAGPW